MTEQTRQSFVRRMFNGFNSVYSVPILAFILALVVRLAAIPVSLIQLNPYATSDAIGFANAASLIAQRTRAGQSPFSLSDYSLTYEIWGSFLSPFWQLPGPSEIYAHVFVAVLGSIAVYNVAVIAQHYHSPQAGLFAGLPLSFYPTIVMTHAALVREAAVLFGITSAARFLLAAPPQLEDRYTGTLVLTCLGFATVLRPENAPLYAGAIGVGLFLWILTSDLIYRIPVLLTSIPVGIFFAVRYINSAMNYVLSIRDRRGRGRTAYLIDVPIEEFLDLIAFSWIGALYFLYTPFIWMIELPRDFIVGTEAIISIFYTIAAIVGLPLAVQRYPIRTVTLVIAFLVGIVFYGFGTANVGTAARHRPMFLWVVFVFGGISIAHKHCSI
ncbi:hypothetical protein [Natrinema salifodinae]|uniref:Dolichyl-phosphate-mannose-protein mannosyltransferase n=1 Tax=Natrinema salifodinae TaxID=1202768 RepID=A0A1I0M1C8_9EURY|nr:hypothetical protein [Natrinema salifodinae]SEV81741.1 hypothetical protein SAMN05216285_0258 [Natrinema salifodinae]